MKTITNIIISHLALLILFGSVTLVFAQTEEEIAIDSTEIETVEVTTAEDDNQFPNNEERVENRDERQDTRESATEEMQTEREAVVENRQNNLEDRGEAQVDRQENGRVNLSEQSRQRIKNLAALMSNRIEGVIARMENIANRLESRIEKLSNQGIDTAEATTALVSARISLDNAANEINDIDNAVANVIGSEDVRSAWPELRLTFERTKDLLKTSQNELRNSVTALKTAINIDAENPTSEEENI
jgi:hypothetical protein